ncbi:MAG: PQQ-binding-like beta-propeller repeat protein [Planctomycetaceae bacterium]
MVVGSRDALDRHDVFQCLDSADGSIVWQHSYPALGNLDYGNAPRATPLIDGEFVYTLGAFGHLCCLELESGIMMWQLNIAKEFSTPKMIWGHSGSPLLVDGKLILQTGGREASMVALDAETGDLIWKTAGNDASYSSLLLKTVGEAKQVIGYDAKSLGGWDVKTGKRLWTLIPPETGDFNVPTAVSLGDRLLVSSENNGTRIYHFNFDGTLHSEPDYRNDDLRPDSHTPVLSGQRLFGIWNELFVLDTAHDLKTVAAIPDDAFAGYGSLVATDSRLLALNDDGELLLIDTLSEVPQILSRLKLQQDRVQVLSHPAIAGDAIFVRLGKNLVKLKLQ